MFNMYGNNDYSFHPGSEEKYAVPRINREPIHINYCYYCVVIPLKLPVLNDFSTNGVYS